MRLLLVLLLCGLSGCAPRGVPRDASVHWNFKSGFYWTWARNFERGCAAWMAEEGWADVQLLVGSKCKGARESGHLAERGLSYFSAEDHLTFLGYWPWSERDYFKLIVFDDHGMVSGVPPCPYALSGKQIEQLRSVAQEAFAGARTDGERRVLDRVRQRLASLDHTKLASSQQGCTDYDAAVKAIDVWADR